MNKYCNYNSYYIEMYWLVDLKCPLCEIQWDLVASSGEDRRLQPPETSSSYHNFLQCSGLCSSPKQLDR